ncbi:hypothetical protein [Streptomyces sp. CB03911]|uniref:hypothetical protein n=1 Tax=Streptomyces sp. CB03911 TaxID=1804758 RepID=UPI00093E17F4|nr:hypothetical protein [Streptomyces sp. CB03911]OKI14181.1 hypothetical protein A6A07_13600 [Streptomyces sp. CB03911]
MTDYSGPATVTADDQTFDVDANLIVDNSQPLKSWGGVIHFEDEGQLWTVAEARTAQLALPDGGEGAFIAGHRELGGTRLEITGSGPAPI